MIQLTGMNGQPTMVAPDQIESLAATPDTVRRKLDGPGEAGNPIAFDDISTFDDHSIQRMLKEVDGNAFAVALKVAGVELLARVYKNMSTRAATLLKEDIGLGPIRPREVAEAQQQIVDVIRALEEGGQIRIPRTGRANEPLNGRADD